MNKLLLTALCCALSAFVFAQTPAKTITVQGVALDSVTNKAMAFVTVSISDAETKKPVKSSLTKDDGSFVIKGLPPKSYLLSLVYVGYKTHAMPVKASDGTVNVGTIRLSASNKQLKQVDVSAAKPLVKQEIDRLSYDIQADPENKALNMLEMMRKIPLLSLDGDDNLLLKGASNYKIFINGKPSSLMVHSPKEALRAMPATSIQKIEVITTPPAKYDSEGLDGIINIVTNKRVDNGYNGSL